ncbi:putative calcium-binding protein cml26 [Fagus crenata]
MGRATIDHKALPVPTLTEDQLQKIFKKYDFNNDGLLSKEELKKAFDYLGSCIPGIRASHGIHHADANRDGYVNEEELNELVKYAKRVGFRVK